MRVIALNWFAGPEELADSCLVLTYVLFVDSNAFPMVFSACKTSVLFQFCRTSMCKVQYAECCAESGGMYQSLSDTQAVVVGLQSLA